MDGRSGPAPAAAGAEGGDGGGGIRRGATARERFVAGVRGAAGLSHDERERILTMGLRALNGEAGLGVV
ncbi:MAG: hypothetical protein ACM30G_04835 [Micromonosporaceae bacterium]